MKKRNNLLQAQKHKCLLFSAPVYISKTVLHKFFNIHANTISKNTFHITLSHIQVLNCTHCKVSKYNHSSYVSPITDKQGLS